MNDYDVAQLARLEPAYQERLGLDTAPFPPTHEDRFLYLDAERRQRLQMLQHLTQYSNLLLLVVGERGVGKTSLLERFVVEARPEWRICRIQANPLMDADQLLHEIAVGFGLSGPPHDPESLQDALFRHLLALREQDRTPILIIDDAHELPLDALQAVFHLADAETAEGNLLRSILACEPQIETMLADPAIAPLRERITHTLDVPPLDRAGMADYLAHRLAVAGYSGASPFTDKALEHIWRRSQGIPARINEAAHLWLSDGGAGLTPHDDQDDTTHNPDTDHTTTGTRPLRQIVFASLIAGLLILALLFQDRINALFAPSPAADRETPAAHDETAAPAAGQVPAPPVTEPAVAPPATPHTESTPVADEAPEPPPAQATVPTPVPSIEHIEPAVIRPGTQPVTLTLTGQNFTADSRIVIRRNGQPKRLPDERVDWIDTHTARITIVPGKTPVTLQIQVVGPGEQRSSPVPVTIEVPAPTAARPTPPPPRAQVPTSLWDRDWIDRQPPDHYTLQLLSTRNRASVERFVAHHGLKGRAVAFETRHNGQTWYSVIVGSYPDREQARQAFRKLPASMQTVQPWIRRFAGIQAGHPATRSDTPPPAAFRQPPPDNLARNDHLAWLWSRDPSHYTLQLIAGHDEAGIRRFMQRHKLSGQAAYYRAHRAGQDVFVVVYGDYADRKTARAAIATLPAELRRQKPWPRRFGDIHAELETH